MPAGPGGKSGAAGPDLAARALGSRTGRRLTHVTSCAARECRAPHCDGPGGPAHPRPPTAAAALTHVDRSPRHHALWRGGDGARRPVARLPPSWPRLSSILFAPACPHILTCLATQATLSRLSLTLIVRRHGLSSSNWAHASLSALLRFRSFSHQDSRCSSKGAVGKGRRQVAPSRCTPTAPVAWRRSK